MKKLLYAFYICVFICSNCFASEDLDSKLLSAIRSNNLVQVKSLLSKGASPDAADFKGSQPAYELALLSGYYDIAALLAKNGANTRGITELMVAARKDDLSALTQLIAKKTKVSAKDDEGDTALTYAILADSIECVKILLNHGCSVRERNDSGATPLFTAQSAKMLRFLCQHGGDINSKNNFNETPIFTFASSGYVAMVKTALALGADPNIVDKGGRTPLGWIAGECDRGNPTPSYLKIRALLKAIGAKEIGKDAEG